MATRSYLTTATATTRRRLTHPSEYAELRLRLLADRGIYTDNAQATAAAVDQDAIGTWMDTRRPYLKFTQATGANKPKLLTEATPAGGNAIRFTAADSTILTLAMSATAGVRAMDFRTQEHTVVAALRCPITPASTAILFAPNNADNYYVAVGSSNANQLRHAFRNAANTGRTTGTPADAFTVDEWFVGAWRLKLTSGDYTTGDMEQHIRTSNGVTVTTARPADGSLQNTTSTQWNVGGLTSAANLITVDVAELDVYGAALTDAELAALVAELVLTHGITG